LTQSLSDGNGVVFFDSGFVHAELLKFAYQFIPISRMASTAGIVFVCFDKRSITEALTVFPSSG
jgi:hypothetical protein